ncbi:MAG: VWA domain-containing protein [Candidatus Nealsonbacteria bacterium]|nr:VWA domain-containing protein [Candidatus Nealsonbacteria bacterium]
MKRLFSLVFVTGLCQFAPFAAVPSYGQAGVSTAAVGMARAGLPPSAAMVVVEEYMNYHRHDIPLPTKGNRVQLDLRWGNAGRGEAVVQVGLATPRIVNTRKMPPLNLALVIDHSGSMSGERIANVKQALLAFVGKLRDGDVVSIIGFNQEASVLLAPTERSNLDQIHQVIETISAGGSTNMHAGLMLGYQQALEHFDKRKTNRVILLTDGIANTGVTAPEQIVADSLRFNERGVDLSTIGLGHDLNHDLLRQLAKSGKGLIHFVGDSKDIQKTFIDELDSLLAPAARRVRVEIQYEKQLDLAHLYGYEPRFDGRRILVDLDNLNHGATQVILARFKVPKRDGFSVTARLSYHDIVSGEDVTQEKTTKVKRGKKDDEALLAGAELRKNVTIAELATGIKRMAVALEQKKYEEALGAISGPLTVAKDHYCSLDDPDVKRVYKIAKKYRDRISDYHRESGKKR